MPAAHSERPLYLIGIWVLGLQTGQVAEPGGFRSILRHRALLLRSIYGQKTTALSITSENQ